MTNQMTYEDDQVVDSYAASDALQTPEQIVLNQFRARLNRCAPGRAKRWRVVHSSRRLAAA